MNSVLNRELFIIAGSGTLLLLLLPVDAPWQLLPAFATFAFVWLRAWQLRDSNRRSTDNTPLASLGLANRLTLLRGWLIAVCAASIWPRPDLVALLIPALCYTLAAVLDVIDGVVARRSDNVTAFGIQLDTSMDALGLLIAPLVAVTSGRLHFTYLLVSAAYYLYIGGLHWRRSHGREVRPLPPSRWRRPLAGVQMAVVATVLWPVLPAALTQALGFIAMLPFLAGFWRDWLSVSARR